MRFSNDASVEKLNNVEELAGGALTGNEIVKDVSSIDATIKTSNILPQSQSSNPSFFQLPTKSNMFLTNTLHPSDLSFRNDISASQYETEMWGLDESIIKRALVGRSTGRGISHDPPDVARAIFDSLQNHPKSLGVYMHA